MEDTINQLSKYLQQTDERILEEATKLCKGQTFPVLIPHLVRLTSHNNRTISGNALDSLIYMSSEHPECSRQIIALGTVTRLLDSVISASPTNINSRLMLLTNITTEHEGTLQLLDMKDSDLKGQKLLRLAIRFANPPESLAIPRAEEIKGLPIMATSFSEDEYQYASFILMNATLIKEGREIFYDNPRFFMPAFLEAMSSPNPIRKQGIIGVIRNLCFEADRHEFMIKQAKIIPHIIKPLVPKSIEDNLTATEMLQNALSCGAFQGMEPLAENRKNLLETIWLLTQSKVGIEALIKSHIVFVLREVEGCEDNEFNKELTIRIGALIIGKEEEEK